MKQNITSLDLPYALWCEMEGPRPPLLFRSNDCTCAPNYLSLWKADLRCACHFHDFHYTLGCGEADRKQADVWLYRNLIRCGAPPLVAGIYFRRVRLWGTEHFTYGHWAKPHRSEIPLMRLRIFFERHVDSVRLFWDPTRPTRVAYT